MSSIDYRQMIHNEKSADVHPGTKWWELKESEMPSAIESTLKFLRDNSSRRLLQLMISGRLYGNLNMLGMSSLSFNKLATNSSTSKDKLTYNVCQSVVDTLTSKITKNKPKPYFLTSGGDYKLQSKAKKLGKFVDGCFYENNLYSLTAEIFRDACVWGDGIIHVYSQNGKIKVERVLVAELYVDEIEGFYGNPRQMHRVKNVDRAVLLDSFPESRQKIINAPKAKTDSPNYINVADQVTVVESWHLPSGENAKDGAHVISISGDVLFKEKYTRNHFPFAFFKYSKRMYGFYAQGIIEQIQNIQTEINKLLWVIQRSMHLAGSFKVLVENGSKIVKEHLNNDIGTIVNYTGAPPQYVTPPIVQPEVYAHLQTLKAAAYEQAGISQLSATSKKPDGLDSGKALREYNDIESERFMTTGMAYEQFFIDITKLMIEEAKSIYQEDKKFAVKVPGRKFIETIPWKDVDMEEDQYILQIFPVSKLPDEPAGRLQTIQEMMQAGLISPQTGRRLLDYPDLESEESLANAQEELLHKILDNIVESGEYETPEPTDNLALAEKLTLEYISQGRMNALEPEKMELLRTFLDQVHLLKEKAMQAMQPEQPQQPMANPQPNQASDLIPNTNTPPAAV